MGFNMNVLETDIEIAYRFLKRWSYPDPSLISKCRNDGKNNLKAVEFRFQGNSEYEVGRDHNALELYTKSVALAKEDSEELALAYGNRSAVLFRFGKYVQCLSDIKRALTGEYPKDRRKKLRERKKKCLVKIKSEKKIDGGDDETDLSSSDYSSEFSLKNTSLPNMSSKVKLACNETWGRHLVATENIEPGEIISHQEFFATFLETKYQYTYCSYCFTRCESLIPCRSCSKMMYCSEDCRSRAFNSYHRVECRMWPFCEAEIPNKFENGFILVALRTLYIGTKQGARLGALVKSLDIHKNIFEDKVDVLNKPFKRDYLSTLRMARTFGKKPSMESILLAVKTVIILQNLSFFGNDANPDLMSETELFATLALLNHMRSIKYYNHAITETSELGEVVIGLGVDPLHNLINHSCNPNVCDATRFRDHLIFSVRPIERGQQIFIAYCTSFANNHLEERKQRLSLFGFTCHCEACTNDWPLRKTLLRRPIKFITKDENLIMNIVAMTNVLNSEAKNEKNVWKVQTFRNVVKYRKMIHNNVEPPSGCIILTEEYIIRYMRKKYGNCNYFFPKDFMQHTDMNQLFEFLRNLASNYQM